MFHRSSVGGLAQSALLGLTFGASDLSDDFEMPVLEVSLE
jgi:hypothetical protein